MSPDTIGDASLATPPPPVGTPTTVMNPTSIIIDFTRWSDYPLIKSKLAVFNSGIVPVSTYERDASLFGVIRPESLRIDLGWGADWTGWTRQPIRGTATAPLYDLAEMDRIVEIINGQGVLPYWSYCYNPIPLQDPPGAWRGVPSDMEAWGRMLGDIAAHYRALGAANPVGYHEVYNEPDNADFTVGTIQDYFAMYQHGVEGIRRSDPDAIVGGPALAFTKEWIGPFVDFVVENRLPLDFFSTHVYGTNDLFQGLASMLDATRDSLDRYPQLATAETHLNEFNSYPIDYPLDGTQQKHRLAAAFLRDMAFLLERPEVTLVHWAQFLDSGQDNYSGMVSIDGHRKAVFNAAEIYARLPTDRVALTIDGDSGRDLGGLAAAEAHRAGVAIWNLSPQSQDVALALDGLPFVPAALREYRIDEDHASWGDDAPSEALVAVTTQPVDASDSVTWTSVVAPGGVLYLELDDGTGQSEAAPVALGRWRRTLHFYPDRQSAAYADFDKTTWTFRLGMAGASTANAQIGVTADSLPDVLRVSTAVDGLLQRQTPESLLGLRLDYRVGGTYRASVLLHGPYRAQGDLYNDDGTGVVAWGTQRSPDRGVSVSDIADMVVPLRELAPEDWDGTVQITAIMTDTGPATRARIVLRAG